MSSFQNKTIYFFFSYIENKYYDYERREKNGKYAIEKYRRKLILREISNDYWNV